MTVTYEDYEKAVKTFYKKHSKGKNEISVYTSPMVDNKYYKTYTSTDGACFTVINDVVRESTPIEVHKIKFTVPIDLYRTEYFSSDDSVSKFFYEKG